MELPAPDWNALAARMVARADEVDDVLALLLDHADPEAGSAEQRHRVAWAMACACLGDGHLWEDLGLASRASLSSLMAHWFPALAARNTQHMRWKKFFYKQICEREALPICRAPSCAVCSEQGVCFGPEEATRLKPLAGEGVASA
jgi:nitrogen fixation protein NifQ